MGDATGELSDRLHFLRLAQLFFQIVAFGDVAQDSYRTDNLPRAISPRLRSILEPAVDPALRVNQVVGVKRDPIAVQSLPSHGIEFPVLTARGHQPADDLVPPAVVDLSGRITGQLLDRRAQVVVAHRIVAKAIERVSGCLGHEKETLFRLTKSFGRPDLFGQIEANRDRGVVTFKFQGVGRNLNVDNAPVFLAMARPGGTADGHPDVVSNRGKWGNSFRGQEVGNPHGEELSAAVAVMLDGRVIDREELEALEVIDPHWVRIAFEE